MGSLKEVKYDAFISYRHSEFDSFVVENLHKKLENFKLPKSVLKKVKNGKTRIKRVFRDVDELPLADNLSEPINDALRNSDYLITVCTPRYPQSRWCMKEIEVFLQTHTRDHILVVLAEDEPVNSFPEILTLEEVETVDEKGEKVIIRRELEPLAADTRGENKKEVLKAMDTAVIKLAAAMFGLNYDDLRQRQREQKIRRMAALFSGIGAAVLGFAIFATATLIKISRQNEMINSQYEELQDSFASSMANVSQQLLEAGRRKDAVYAVRNVLPDSGKDGFNNAAFNALCNAMDVYKVSASHSPVCSYDAAGWISDFGISRDKNYVLLNDDNAVYLYDAATGEKLKQIDRMENTGSIGMYEAAFCGEEGILICDNGEALYYGIKDDVVRPVDMDPESYLYDSPDGFRTYAFFSDILYAVDDQGNVSYTLDIRDLFDSSDPWCRDVYFGDGYVMFCFSDYEKTYMCLIDEFSGEVKCSESFEGAYEMEGIKAGDSLYVAISGVDEDSTYIDYTRVYALDADTGRRRWVSTVEGISLADTGIFATSKYLIIDGRFDVAMLDIGSGDLLKIHTFADALTAGWVEDDWFWFMTEEEGLFNCEESYVNKVTGSFFTVIPTVETGTVIYRDGDLFCWFWESNYVTRYSDAVSSFAERMDDYTPEFDEMDFVDEDIIANEGYNINEQLLEYALYSKDKKYIVAIFTDKVIRIYDTQTKECVGTLISEDEQIEELRYSELTNCYILSGSNSYLMDDKFNVFCETCRIVGEEGNELILMSQDFDVYRIPSLSYEDMLKRADEYLGDYTPPEEVCQKYGIKSVNGDGSD